MAATTGNKFWQIRAKHGRDTLFETPELLWEAACEYFQWCDDNPLIAIDFKGKDAERVEIPKMRPYTIHGLCIYLDCSLEYFHNFETQRGHKKDFIQIINRIRKVIYDQKFSGAASGFFNANIIARDLGLADKTESKVTATVNTIDYSKLSDEALEEIVNASRSDKSEG